MLVNDWDAQKSLGGNETKVCTELTFPLIYYHATLISISRE